jgi:oxygen-independent coproporphyrinogen-3 oxidase
MYQSGVELVTNAGYEHYEISNLAKPSFCSRHNSLYWDGAPYLGLGPAAHSFAKATRHWNFDDVSKYNMLLSNKILPVKESEQLTEQQKLMEFIMLSLRKKDGIKLDVFQSKFKYDFRERYSKALEKLKRLNDGKLVEIDESSVKLTLEGMLLYNEICSYFV